MQMPLNDSPAIVISPAVIFFPRQNKPLHVVLNGANLARHSGALSFVRTANLTRSI
jgi:hypothetical protein